MKPMSPNSWSNLFSLLRTVPLTQSQMGWNCLNKEDMHWFSTFPKEKWTPANTYGSSSIQKKDRKTTESDFGCGVLVIATASRSCQKWMIISRKGSGCREWKNKTKQKPKPVRTEGPLVFLIFVYVWMEVGVEIRVSLNTVIFVGPGFQAFFGYEQDYGRSGGMGNRWKMPAVLVLGSISQLYWKASPRYSG